MCFALQLQFSWPLKAFSGDLGTLQSKVNHGVTSVSSFDPSLYELVAERSGAPTHLCEGSCHVLRLYG